MAKRSPKMEEIDLGPMTAKVNLVTVRMRTTLAGPHGVCSAGSIIEVSLKEAEVLSAGGFADIVSVEQSYLRTNTGLAMETADSDMSGLEKRDE